MSIGRILNTAFGAIVGGIAGATGMVSGAGGAMSLLVGGATMVSGTISATIAGALPTAVYIELRGLKEGPEAQGLDAVFA